MTWGGGVTGVSDTLLRQQRRAAAQAGATGVSTCGQNLDLALIMMDASEHGRADPAFDAHEMPIGQWAQAVWDMWLPREALHTAGSQR